MGYWLTSELGVNKPISRIFQANGSGDSAPSSQALYYGVATIPSVSKWNQLELLDNLKTFKNIWINIRLLFFSNKLSPTTYLRANVIFIFFSDWIFYIFFFPSYLTPPQYWSVTPYTYSSWFIYGISWSSLQTFQINYLFVWRNHNWLFGWETQFTKVARERHSSFCSIIKAMFK